MRSHQQAHSACLSGVFTREGGEAGDPVHVPGVEVRVGGGDKRMGMW